MNESTFRIENTEKQPVVYINRPPCSLDLYIQNEGDQSIQIVQGESVLELFIDPFSEAEWSAMTTHVMWKKEVKAEAGKSSFLRLTYTGETKRIIKDDSLRITLQNVQTKSRVTKADVQLNLSGCGDEIKDLYTTLDFSEFPDPKKLKITDDIQLSLSNQGVIIISENEKDILPNSLLLNLKNTKGEETFCDSTGGEIEVWFECGYGNGCLASAGKLANLEVTIDSKAGGIEWKIEKVNNPHSIHLARWSLHPLSTTGLGTNEKANLTFNFSNIVADTAPGHTQMYLTFKNFKNKAGVMYNDAYIVLDITKQLPPLNRGVISLFSPEPVIQISKPKQEVRIPIQWLGYGVQQVEIFVHTGSIVKEFSFSNHDKRLLWIGKEELPIENVVKDSVIMITLQAMSTNNILLNSLQYAVFVKCDFFYDDRDGAVYPGIQIGKQLWMGKNLDYKGGNFKSNGKYGGLYPADESLLNFRKSGWRLPLQSDWEELILFCGGAEKAYEKLTKTGENEFGAMLGGAFIGGSMNIEISGMYWSATGVGNKNHKYADFYSKDKKATVRETSSENYLSVRLIKKMK